MPNAHAFHSRSQSGLHAGFRVFKNHAMRRVHLQRLSALQEDFRIGLGFGGMGAIHNDIKKVGQLQALQNGHRIFAGRAQGCCDVGLAAGLQKFPCPRQYLVGLHLGDEGHVMFVFLMGEPFLFGRCYTYAANFEQDVERSHTAYPLQSLIVGFAKVEAQLFGQFLPGDVMVFGGVDYNAVQIEQTGFNHGFSVLRVGWSSTKRTARAAINKLTPAITSAKMACESNNRFTMGPPNTPFTIWGMVMKKLNSPM